MGLDLTHQKNDGPTVACSYSGFMAFRKALCAAAGYGDLSEYEGFGGEKKPGHWRTDALWALLDHSDCEGEIASRDNLRGIARRLRELGPGLGLWYSDYAVRLAVMCDDCVKYGIPLEFR